MANAMSSRFLADNNFMITITADRAVGVELWCRIVTQTRERGTENERAQATKVLPTTSQVIDTQRVD